MWASRKSMTDSGRSTSDRSGWVAYMKRRAGSWITSAEQRAERVGITRECVTNQLITKCHLSSELFIRPLWLVDEAADYLDAGAVEGGSFQMSITQRHCPSGSRRQTVTPRPCSVMRAPVGPGTVISLVPRMYANFPSDERTTFSDVQWILKPGICKLAAT